jgi:predicted RNA-binding Zn-ribbon protein involved in translation (DUF1610 family)
VTGFGVGAEVAAGSRRNAVVVEVVSVVYECPDCGERLLERRCAECNVFCRRLGPGGRCPACDEVVLVEEMGAEA